MKIKRTAIILCGGKNTRMEYKHKGFLVYKNKNFLDIALGAISDFEEIIISCREEKLFEQYKDRAKIVVDKYDAIGPIGGICTALKEASFNKALVISCDMPLLNKLDISYIGDAEFNEGILVPMVNGKIQCLCSIFDKKVISDLEVMIENEDYKIKNIYKRVSVRYIFPKNQEMFLNVNTVEDYIKLRKSEEAK